MSEINSWYTQFSTLLFRHNRILFFCLSRIIRRCSVSEPERDVYVYFSSRTTHLPCFNAWLRSQRMLPLCDRDHYFLARATKMRVDFWIENVTSRAKCRYIASKNAPAKSRVQGNAAPVRSHCSESLFTWTTFQGCCAHLLRRNAHSSLRFTKRRLYR